MEIAIKEAFERAITYIAFREAIQWIRYNFSEYPFHIIVGLIILGILIVLGLVIERREKRNRKSVNQ